MAEKPHTCVNFCVSWNLTKYIYVGVTDISIHICLSMSLRHLFSKN